MGMISLEIHLKWIHRCWSVYYSEAGQEMAVAVNCLLSFFIQWLKEASYLIFFSNIDIYFFLCFKKKKPGKIPEEENILKTEVMLETIAPQNKEI